MKSAPPTRPVHPDGVDELPVGAGPVASGLVELSPDTFTCAAMADLPHPAVLVWAPTEPLPAPGIASCTDRLDPNVHRTDEGSAVFSSSTIRP